MGQGTPRGAREGNPPYLVDGHALGTSGKLATNSRVNIEDYMVRKEGFEPPRPFGHKILSLARLPVPPLPQWCFYSTSLPRAAPPRFSADALSLLRPSL